MIVHTKRSKYEFLGLGVDGSHSHLELRPNKSKDYRYIKSNLVDEVL